MEILRIAVVGTGGRAKAHLATIPKLTDMYQLVAVCDIDEGISSAASACYNVPGYTDAEEMLKAEKPHIVLVAVRPDGHHAITEIATAYGAHILTETPIATTLAYADLMISAARKRGVVLEEAENVWRWPHERMKRVLVDSGIIGEVTHGHLWYTSGSYHGVNAIRTLVRGEAKCVVGYTPKGTGVPRELGVIEFENGASVLYEWPTRRRGNYWEVDGTKGALVGNEVQLYDGQEIQRYPIQTVLQEREEGRIIVECRVDMDPPLVWENPLKGYGLGDADDVARAASLHSIYQAVTKGVKPEYGAENARKDQEILVAIRESARKGSVPIDLPLTEVTEYEQQLHQEYKTRYGHDPLEVGRDEARLTRY